MRSQEGSKVEILLRQPLNQIFKEGEAKIKIEVKYFI